MIKTTLQACLDAAMSYFAALGIVLFIILLIYGSRISFGDALDHAIYPMIVLGTALYEIPRYLARRKIVAPTPNQT